MIFYDIVFVKPFWTYIYIYTYRCQGKMACNYMCSLYTLHSWPFAIFTPRIVSKTASRANGTGHTNSGERWPNSITNPDSTHVLSIWSRSTTWGSSSGSGPGRWRSGTEAWLKFRRGSIGRSVVGWIEVLFTSFFWWKFVWKNGMLSWLLSAHQSPWQMMTSGPFWIEMHLDDCCPSALQGPNFS